ncbi:MAG TPA: Hsp20/alpha crystallin family protein [Paludibacteraceae bacterium]|jgi:HSP20 family protein|nr:Hsp20/alpha crystallin family protein [Paludibacteraceae bacterium]
MSLVRFSQTPWFDRFFDNDLLDWSNRNFSQTNTTLPSVNIKENDDAFMVEVAVPGMDKKDFKIEVHNDLMTISSEKQEENETKNEKEHYTKREFSYQAFTRSFTLPATANGDNVSAAYDKGILLVTIPKKEEAKPKPARMIEIK